MKRIRFSALAIGVAVAIAWGMVPAVAELSVGPQAIPPSDSGKIAEQHFEKAIRFLKQENFQDAILQYEKVLDDYKKKGLNDTALFRIAECYYNIGDYPSALNYFKKIAGENTDVDHEK